MFMPLPGDGGMVSWMPGAAVVSVFDAGTAGGSSLVQLIGNVLLLLAAGALATLRWPWFRRVGRMVLVAGLVAAAIEVVQWLLEAGRVSATDDVILNACGAVVGMMLVRPWWKTAGTDDARRAPVSEMDTNHAVIRSNSFATPNER